MEEKLQPSRGTSQFFLGLLAIGIISFGVGLFTNAERAWYSYLIADLFFLGLGIGATVFLVLHYLSGSGWFVLVRRVLEGLSNHLKVTTVTTLVLFFGLSYIYPWTDQAMMEADHFLHHKVGYFSTSFWGLRVLVFMGILVFFSTKILNNSLRQDSEGGVELRNKQKPLSAGFLVLFAPLFTVFVVDTIMSIDPKWFSTIFGVYVFVGFIQTATAVTIISIYFLKKGGNLKLVREDHLHDLGKYLFGWSIFWGYIAVSQYLLIWYANLPEETIFYLSRNVGNWTSLSLLVPLTKFLLPFLLLLPRAAKRNINYLCGVALIVVFSEILDLMWMILPGLMPAGYSFHWLDAGLFLGFLGLFGTCIRRFYSKHSLVPMKDPYLHESKDHHVVYA